MNFCMPADFSENTIRIINKLKKEYPKHRVEELYGNISPTPILGSGRGWNINDNDFASLKELQHYIKLLNENGISFNYTLNTACTENMELQSEGLKRILEFIGELVDIGVRRITLVAPSLIDIVHRNFPELEITASVISGVNSVIRAKNMKKLGVKTIALQEDLTRDFKLISSISENVDIKLEMIVNSMCDFNCVYRQSHYNALSHYKSKYSDTYIGYYCDNCLRLRKENQEEIIKSPWVRPEDLQHYADIGIGLFKIIGRERISGMNIEKMLKSYFEQSFEGNLLELIYGFSETPTTYIDNKSLEGFLDFFHKDYKCLSLCGTDNCKYCSEYAKKAIKSKGVAISSNMDLEDFYEYGITTHLCKDDLIEGLS